MERQRLPLTVTLDETMIGFIKPKEGPLFKKIRIKPTQLVELALEEYLKNNGHWGDYENFKATQPVAEEEQY